MRLSACAVIVALILPGVAGAAALNVSGGGILNGGNLSVAVSGNGITAGCINFFNLAMDACDLSGSNTFVVGAPSDSNLFTFGSTAQIKDIPAPNVLPETAFLAIPGPSTVHFDVTSVVLPNQVACTAGNVSETCSIGNFVFSQTCDASNVCNVLVSFSLKADAYTGTHATGFTPYAVTFTSQFVNTNVGNLITTIAGGGSIQDSVSFSASPSGPK